MRCLPLMEPPSRVLPTLAGGDRGGARAAKKIAIAGAVVVVAAPVILPALLILFAVGVALALPSALFLASVACADKLMSALLGRLGASDAGNGDADGETVVDEDGGDGVEIPVEAESPDREVGQESRDIEVEEITKEREAASKQDEASHGQPSPRVEENQQKKHKREL